MAGASVVGIDFGTLSGRAVVVRVEDGAELGSAVHECPHAVIERELPATGERLPRDWALQDPEDYVEVLREAVPAAVAASAVAPEEVIGVAIDFTASTPMPTLADGTPLCALEAFRDRPHAYPKLWKHHAAQGQADRINALAAARRGWRATAGGSPRSGSSPRRCSCSRRTQTSTPRWTASSRAPTGSSGSSAARRPATPARRASGASARTGTRRPPSSPRSTSASPASSPTTSRARPSRRSAHARGRWRLAWRRGRGSP